ncbi:MAG: hypothetical protein H0X42_01310 [Solirubrobacterales bacterium]|nr:hypothetical protein [Solirubrobacterales bacterium]
MFRWIGFRNGKRSIGVMVMVLAALGAGACLSGCGGGGGASQEEIAKAQHRGALHRAEQERLRKLERELKEDHRTAKTKAVVVVPNTESATETSPGPSGTDCGNNLVAGPETSCGFAENVRTAYEDEIGVGSGSLQAYSPANETVYNMFCTAGSPHECSGAITATVYFP